MRQDDYSYQHDTSLPEVPPGTYVEMTDHDKALCFDEICRMVYAYNNAVDELAKKTANNYQEWAKGLDKLRIGLSTQVRMVELRSVKVKDEEYFINCKDGKTIHRKDYATVDIEKTLDRFCKYFESKTNVKWKWGRDVYVTGKNCRDFDIWIKGGNDFQYEFYRFSDEFTPAWDDWWWILDFSLPSFLTPDRKAYWPGNASAVTKKEIYIPDSRVNNNIENHAKALVFENELYGVKNAKDISNRLKELGF